MFARLKAKFMSLYAVQNYLKILPYVRPYWIRALAAVLITIPIGSMDAVIAWSLKPYMDVYTGFDYCFQHFAKSSQLSGHISQYLGWAENCQ